MTRDPEETIQRWLALVPRRPAGEYELPTRFDARAAGSRLAMIALAAHHPLDLIARTPVDVAATFDDVGVGAFQRVAGRGTGEVVGSPANRILHPPVPGVRGLVMIEAERVGPASPVLVSHLLSPEALRALARRDLTELVKIRCEDLQAAVRSMGVRLGAWDQGDRDRPSLEWAMRAD